MFALGKCILVSDKIIYYYEYTLWNLILVHAQKSSSFIEYWWTQAKIGTVPLWNFKLADPGIIPLLANSLATKRKRKKKIGNENKRCRIWQANSKKIG